MKLKLFLKNGSYFSAVFIIAAFIWLTGCSKDNNNTKAPDNQTQQTGKDNTKDMSLVRDKNVNVDSLDQDKDGNLYQCEMDYDVISDKPGTCPKCGMELKKVSVADAKKNLNAYDSN